VIIELLVANPAIKAQAKAVWLEKVREDISGKYLIGLQFSSIAPADLKRMIGYVRWIRISSFLAAGALVISLITAAVVGGYNYRLRRINESLVNRLIAAQQEEIEIHAAVQEIIKEGNVVLEQIEASADDPQEQEELRTAYDQITERKDKIEDHLAVVEREKEGLQTTVLRKMHQWLANHQDPSTGLVLSAEGGGADIKNTAFTYDQALAVQAFLMFEDHKGARQVLNFFNARAGDDFEGFHSAYHHASGDIAEAAIQSGPNIWIGMSALQYVHSTGDKYYLPLARTIADWLIAMQEKDPAGGLRGGPALSWFGIEHNFDAYAFFNMMHKITQEEKYSQARESALAWLKDNAMVSSARKYALPPDDRGRGDATLATDTYAWALAALGPEKLKETGQDPEQIMQFAEEYSAAEVSYRRPSGITLSVRGFDFSPEAWRPDGGSVSSEWTAQMVVCFRILSEYFVQKGDFYKAMYYEEKAQIYLGELNKLIISSPSARGRGEGCLPHGTREKADTGHGWVTSAGTSSCSVSGTAYMIMAIKYWNPLILEKGNIRMKTMEGYL
ncbi:MAG TPA: hypothetical protein PKV41_05945, partial [Candidatus Omnitrophota bacterium]|nr:hypothetical protein [Candidatus Omnitrophota bacterium]